MGTLAGLAKNNGKTNEDLADTQSWNRALLPAAIGRAIG
jgi:hypothetical protein